MCWENQAVVWLFTKWLCAYSVFQSIKHQSIKGALAFCEGRGHGRGKGQGKEGMSSEQNLILQFLAQLVILKNDHPRSFKNYST